MSQKFTPRGARVLIRKAWEAEVRDSGLVIPENARSRPMRGVVEAIGPGAVDLRTGILRPIEGLRIGDEVLFLRYAGVETKLNDKEYVVLQEQDVAGVFSPGSDVQRNAC